ncbi:hypothetical protein NC653_013603 [Populus alba x Populus x berolinensis]|uniref:Uncharacterized protein n=1 Tax=Populus alba x Populus x berolinensis TaxID=444605 RepID=A0AAD6QV22_9ROSI|nr:hypothetical protein NC653_013603 [Populus alba x Populus x berolinensis]
MVENPFPRMIVKNLHLSHNCLLRKCYLYHASVHPNLPSIFPFVLSNKIVEDVSFQRRTICKLS